MESEKSAGFMAVDFYPHPMIFILKKLLPSNVFSTSKHLRLVVEVSLYSKPRVFAMCGTSTMIILTSFLF
jgi:hypothetical protein